jgi:hypothetical protein
VKIYNNYILSLVIVSAVINALLAYYHVDDLSIYFVVNTLAYLVITLLYVYFNPRARRALNVVSAVLFAGFAVVVALKVIEVVAGQ